jgi:hypothetical protein
MTAGGAGSLTPRRKGSSSSPIKFTSLIRLLVAAPSEHLAEAILAAYVDERLGGQALPVRQGNVASIMMRSYERPSHSNWSSRASVASSTV